MLQEGQEVANVDLSIDYVCLRIVRITHIIPLYDLSEEKIIHFCMYIEPPIRLDDLQENRCDAAPELRSLESADWPR